MKKIIVISALTASLFAANSTYEIGAGIGRDYISNAPIDNNNFGNIRIGKYLQNNNILRFELEKTKSVNVENQSKSLTRALLNVKHSLTTDTKLTPYVFIGVGYQWVEGSYDNNIIADLGAGLAYNINKNTDLFIEARELRDFWNNDNHHSFIGGIEYKFGSNQEPIPEPKVEKPVPKDSDHDGVVDSMDKCPNTPTGVKVTANGCPIDSDNDGVADYLDKCPNTPAGVKVTANGCPIDSDNDGVADYLDKCPNTPAGVEVTANGCAVNFKFDITFKNNSYNISSEFMPTIHKFVTFLEKNPAYKAEIIGYTDNIGPKIYNSVISLKRAKAVYEKLIKSGISKNRLSFVGYGEENPIASNKTKEGRAKNRRVIAKLFF